MAGMSVVAWSRPTKGGVLFAEAIMGQGLFYARGGTILAGPTRGRRLLGAGGPYQGPTRGRYITREGHKPRQHLVGMHRECYRAGRRQE